MYKLENTLQFMSFDSNNLSISTCEFIFLTTLSPCCASGTIDKVIERSTEHSLLVLKRLPRNDGQQAQLPQQTSSSAYSRAIKPNNLDLAGHLQSDDMRTHVHTSSKAAIISNKFENLSHKHVSEVPRDDKKAYIQVTPKKHKGNTITDCLSPFPLCIHTPSIKNDVEM